MVDQLFWHTHASGLTNIDIVNVGVSDDNRTGELLIRKSDTAIVSITEVEDGSVRMRPLLDILNDQNVKAIHGMKIDIEGHEDPALVPFFASAPEACFPSVSSLRRLKAGWTIPVAQERSQSMATS